jgi:DNA-binding transcriptional MerR regulator
MIDQAEKNSPLYARLRAIVGEIDRVVSAQDAEKASQLVEPFVTPVTPEITPADIGGWIRSTIAGGIGLYLQNRGGGVTLDQLADVVALAGIDPDAVELTTKQVIAVTGVTERTIRRYTGSGKLIPKEVTTDNGKAHLFTVAQLSDVFGARSSVIDKARTNPLEDLAGSVDRMTAGFDDVIRDQQKQTQELIEMIKAQAATIEAQGRLIDELRAEQRDTRAQIHQLHETTVKALMPREKQSFWKKRAR